MCFSKDIGACALLFLKELRLMGFTSQVLTTLFMVIFDVPHQHMQRYRAIHEIGFAISLLKEREVIVRGFDI